MTVITKMLVTQGKTEKEWQRRFNGEMSGFYDGAQKLGLAAAVVPAVVGATNVITAGVKAVAAKGAK